MKSFDERPDPTRAAVRSEGDRMNVITRRRALAAGCAAVVASLAALAQTTVRRRRVAHLGFTSLAAGGHLIEQLRSGLSERGWVEGRNLAFDLRWAEGDGTRLAPLTQELLALGPDVFVASTDGNARFPAAATRTIPIVFVIGDHPVEQGLVRSLAAPGRNVTGFSALNSELSEKRLALLKEAVPRLDRAGVMFKRGEPTVHVELESLERSARRMKVELIPAPVDGPDDIGAAMMRIADAGGRGLVYLPHPLFFGQRQQLAALSLRHRIAECAHAIDSADAGALLAYATDFSVLYRRAAGLVDRILKGANPATIPVEQANVYEFVVNLQTARALGIELPYSVHLQATRVIE